MRQKTIGGITFLVSLAVFLILSNYIAEWYVFHQMGFDNNFRFENGAHVKSDVLNLYLDYAAGQKGFKIAVVGDSVIQGAGVSGRNQTITAHLQEDLRNSYLPDARVFNFGFPGARPADLLMAVKSLHQAGAANFLVINISYPFFSEDMAQEPLQYFKVWRPMLTEAQKKELKVPPEAPEEQAAKTDSTETTGGSPAETFLQKKVAEYWSVYRFRQELNRFLFGGQPAVKVREYFDIIFNGKMPAPDKGQAEPDQTPLSEKDRPEHMYNVWTSFAWSAQDLEHLRKVFNVTGKDNVDFKYYRELCSYLEENKIPAVIFMSPVNHALLQRYHLLDYNAYKKNTAAIAQTASRQGLTLLNYQEAASPDQFHDSLHLLDSGNAAIARLLSKDLQPTLQGVQAK